MSFEIRIEDHENEWEFDDEDVEPELYRPEWNGISEERIRFRMTHSRQSSVHNISLGEYMRKFEPMNPDVIFFTANSAVPSADSVRGWYDMTGGKLPVLDYVRANSELAINRTFLSPEQELLLDSERQRLTERYAGSNAIVVDQYVATGATINLAAQLLKQSNITVAGMTRDAKWYGQASGAIDLENVTSEHAQFMRRIGREAVYASSEDYLSNNYY